MSVRPDARGAAEHAFRRAVELCRTAGPFAFGRLFAPHHLSGPASDLHRDLNAWHAACVAEPPGRMDAYAAPRGHGKSTAGVEIPALWHAAYGHRQFIVIVSNTWTQAVERLSTIVHEIETNAELRAAFPDLRPAIDERGMVVAWRDDDIVLANGVRVIAAGAGKAIRGIKSAEKRPDLLLLDDLEDETSVATGEALAKRLKWINSVALALSGPNAGIDALWVGTILSRRALMNQATGAALDPGADRPEWAKSWRPHVYRAELPGTERREVTVTLRSGAEYTAEIGEPMWSSLTREKLATIRGSIGAYSYAAEYNSDPSEDGTAILAPARRAHFLNADAPPLQRIVRTDDGRLVPVASMTRACWLDPQYADPGASNDPDLGAIAVVGQAGPESFILDGWLGRDRHGQAGRLVSMGVRWGCYVGGVEANAAQVLTADAAAASGRLPIVAKASTQGKQERALGLAARLGDRNRQAETCRVHALDAEGDVGEILYHLERYPTGRYDDPVDAVVGALGLATAGAQSDGGGGSAPLLGGGRER